MSNVISKPAGRARVGFLRPGHIEGAFIALLYFMLLVLVLLSIVGTFYGYQGQNAPLTNPVQIWRDLRESHGLLGYAFGIQLVLTLVQYGARQFAQRDRRWWILYLVALGISVYYNVQAYWSPLIALIPFYAAGPLIVAGDVLPEFLAVRRD